MAIYGTLADAMIYHDERGNDAWAASTDGPRQIALLRGAEYVDRMYGARFAGTRTGGRAQDREWPRTGATDIYGTAFDVDDVPFEAERAAYEAALRELVALGSLEPDVIPSRITQSETVVGAISVTYANARDASDARPVVSIIDEIIRPLLVSDARSGLSGSVARG